MSAEMKVNIDGGTVSMTGSAGLPILQDGAGRVISQSVAQTAFDLYSEATTSRLVSGNTTNQTWINNVASAWVSVNLTALTGGTAPTVLISLQQQDANGIFHTIASGTALSAVGTDQFSMGPGLARPVMVGNTYRLAWVITGTPATCSFQISVKGR